MLHVCSLATLHDTVRHTGARYVLTVMGNVEKAERPPSVLVDNHLKISMDDITDEAEGFVAPNAAHVDQVLSFIRRWPRDAPLVIHCYAGISRSTASAFAAACLLAPHLSEEEIARRIRKASPSAYPNRLIVRHADAALGRSGRMLRALDAMGPGEMVLEGRPFMIDID